MYSTGNFKSTPIPPQLPAIISLSTTWSIFINLFVLNQDLSIFNAPLISSSSAVVSITSTGGCFKFLSSSTAIAIATPIPSSAPNVVLFPVDKISPSNTSFIGSFLKSWSTSGLFSQTISICACIIMGFLFSYPELAGFLIKRLFFLS